MKKEAQVHDVYVYVHVYAAQTACAILPFVG